MIEIEGFCWYFIFFLSDKLNRVTGYMSLTLVTSTFPP